MNSFFGFHRPKWETVAVHGAGAGAGVSTTSADTVTGAVHGAGAGAGVSATSASTAAGAGVGVSATSPSTGEGEGDHAASGGSTIMTSFWPDLQWSPTPEMYHLLPLLVNTIVSCPLLHTCAVEGTEHFTKSVPFTLITLSFQAGYLNAAN